MKPPTCFSSIEYTLKHRTTRRNIHLLRPLLTTYTCPDYMVNVHNYSFLAIDKDANS